jgi:membrane-bound serine protease (ClpP class)
MIKKSFYLLMVLLFFSVTLYSSEKTVSMIRVREAITPVTEMYILRAIALAERSGDTALLIELDTPGGLLETTRNIVQILLNSRIDTIVFVTPKGARAGSAGVFITLAAKYSGISPGCNIGAAHPVTIGDNGKPSDDNTRVLAKKIENDTVAFIQSIAKTRSRNADWAVRSVRDSVSITGEDAQKNGIVDHIAGNAQDLLKQIYGKDTVYRVREVPKSWSELLLTVLANPNLVYFLLILGFYGILYEIIHPGTIFSGAIGAIFLILALYSNQVLPFQFAGFLLILVAFVLFILEIFIASHGLLTIGGAVSLILGSALLYDNSHELFRLQLSSIITVTASTIAVVALLTVYAGKMIRKKASSGKEGMTGATGVADSDFISGKGKIRFHGELWNATTDSDTDIGQGDQVIVLYVDGLTLKVQQKKRR